MDLLCTTYCTIHAYIYMGVCMCVCVTVMRHLFHSPHTMEWCSYQCRPYRAHLCTWHIYIYIYAFPFYINISLFLAEVVLLLHVWECCWAFTRFDKWPHFLYDLGLFVHGPEKLLNVFYVRFVCIWIVMKLRAVYCMLRCSQSADCLVCIDSV